MENNQTHTPPESKQSTNRPSGSKFAQQRMASCTNAPNLKTIFIICLIAGIIFVTFGSVILSYSIEVIEISKRYDDHKECDDTEWDNPQTCTVEFDIDDDMNSPIYIYYELRNFPSNSRFFSKSKDTY